MDIMTGYYDIVLGLIPLALVGITGSLLGLGLELTTAVPVSAMAAVALIGHAMFVRTPVSPAANETSRSSRTEFQSAD